MAQDNNLLGSGDQESQLEDALKIVKREAHEMKRCLDKEQIIEALRHATLMLTELKTNFLSPKFYYRLYIDATSELQHLESFLRDYTEKENCSIELYEKVQYAGSIIPRLYLMITIGVVQMKTNKANRSDVLHDLVEMCRGVQHPLRGLFLRNYLLQTTRNLLPDTPSTSSHEEGNVIDAINFILTNFGEMNKLWVRMQHQGPSKEREKREKERMELRILVGTNMVRLSQLENVNVALYQERILPGILEQVVSCRDHISQEYLMECIMQVFPDDFHLSTLKELLESCGELESAVNMKNVLCCVMDRVEAVAVSSSSSSATQLFHLISNTAHSLITHRNMSTEDMISLHHSLASLAFKCFPDNTDYSHTVYSTLQSVLVEKGVSQETHYGNVGRELVKVLQLAITSYSRPTDLAAVSAFIPLLNMLDLRSRSRVAAFFIQNLLDKETRIDSHEEMSAFLSLIAPLVENDDGELQREDIEGDDFIEEQNLVGKAVHVIEGEDPDSQYLLLSEMRKAIGRGGAHRMRRTLPAILFELFRLARLYKSKKDNIDNWDAKLRKLFLSAMQSVNAILEGGGNAELPLRLYLEAALAADSVEFTDTSSVVYELFSKALSVVEDEMPESRTRLNAISLLISSLLRVHSIPEEENLSLSNQITLLSTTLFKKPDQVRGLAWSVHLFWRKDGLRDENKVTSVISKALKTTTQCMEPAVQVQLLTTLINTMHTLYAEGCDTMKVEDVCEVVRRAQDGAAQLERGTERDAVEKHLAASIAAIVREAARDGALVAALGLQ